MARASISEQQTKSQNAQVITIHNPATGEPVDTVLTGTRDDAKRTIDQAEAAFESWANLAPSKRAEMLYRGAQTVLEHKDELSRLLTCEQGKPLREAGLEIQRFVHTLTHYAGLGKEMRGGHVSLGEGRYAMIIKVPFGVCGAIIPWNFPVALMGNKIAPALLAGNTVVVKPASTAPLTAIRCIELLQQSGLPPGVLNVIAGAGSVVGQEILENSKVRKIGFTGATDTGRGVMKTAAQEIKRVTLELGGSDPMIVCDDADLDRAVSAASVGRFFNCGQACLAIKRLYLFDSIADEFIEKLVAKAKKLVVGNGLEKGTMIGPLHTSGQRQEVEEQVQDAVDRGATVLVGGKRPQGEQYEKGFFYLPTLLTDVDESSKVIQEEVFGPALPIIRVKDLDEAIAKANNCIFGLGSSVWTGDLKRAAVAGERIESGYTWINSPQIIYDELPFGGFKQSGLGQEHGSEALDHYLQTKSVVVAP